MSRKQLTKRLCWLFLTIVVALSAFLLFIFVGESQTTDYRKILTKAKLAELPGPMTNLKYEIRKAESNERWLFIRFQAEPNDVQSFIDKSPSVDINRKRPMNTASYSAENPVWWSIDRSSTGQIYGLKGQGSIRAGNVIVDEGTDTVLIFIWYTANMKVKALEEIWHDVKDIFN
jgi:hypothetical protein